MTRRVLTLEEFEERCRPGAETHERELHDPDKTPEEWSFVMDHNVRLDDGRRPFVFCIVEGEGFYMGVRFPIVEGGWYIPLLKLETERSADKKQAEEKTQAPDVPQK